MTKLTMTDSTRLHHLIDVLGKLNVEAGSDAAIDLSGSEDFLQDLATRIEQSLSSEPSAPPSDSRTDTERLDALERAMKDGAIYVDEAFMPPICVNADEYDTFRDAADGILASSKGEKE